ncbi:MarR family winged helix-turn-helix transcriptional regulator [Actinoplanes flavus]|uniref:MarR family transcriptional regulator n=1 Tax=Actinoplanes flavus TaxID=2820290 RepID=A0ABS3UB02_9ACTN|nr:MarR family transcriptional regulator [Actinoplanes flavus]MBO3735958.1 MarR family transcriptional regulator [Actinoplanes flavus]
MRDAADDFLDQWAAQRDDLDLDAMGTIGRILRLSRFVNARLKEYFAEHDLETWEFDVIATLRRSARPLTPKELAESVMIGSAALTNRIDRLVARGLVSREAVPGNRRSLHVTLTAEGRDLVDATIEGHVRNQRGMLGGLDADDAERFNRTLRTLLISLGDSR